MDPERRQAGSEDTALQGEEMAGTGGRVPMSAGPSPAAGPELPPDPGAHAESENPELNTMLLWVWTGMMIIVFAIAIFNAVDALP